MAEFTEHLYELAYLASPDLDEASFASLKQSIDERIVALGGSIREEQPVTKRRLAYPIEKAHSAYVVSQYLALSPDGKAALAKELPFNQRVLRHLIAALDEKMLSRLREKRFMPMHAAPKDAAPRRVQPTYTPPPKPAEDKKADITEIERKLDEILGREL